MDEENWDCSWRWCRCNLYNKINKTYSFVLLLYELGCISDMCLCEDLAFGCHVCIDESRWGYIIDVKRKREGR